MTLDLYAQDDLARGLKATVIMALATYAASGAGNTDHSSGILDHAQAQAALFGLDWPAIVASCRQSLTTDARKLLDAALVVIESGKVVNDG